MRYKYTREDLQRYIQNVNGVHIWRGGGIGGGEGALELFHSLCIFVLRKVFTTTTYLAVA